MLVIETNVVVRRGERILILGDLINIQRSTKVLEVLSKKDSC